MFPDGRLNGRKRVSRDTLRCVADLLQKYFFALMSNYTGKRVPAIRPISFKLSSIFSDFWPADCRQERNEIHQ